MEIISRKEAKAKGLIWYFTGKPCAKGHLAKRYVCQFRCSVCLDENSKAWARANPERSKAAQAARNAKRPKRERRARFLSEKARANRRISARRWREKNQEKLAERGRMWRAKNREKIIEYRQMPQVKEKHREHNRKRRDESFQFRMLLEQMGVSP